MPPERQSLLRLCARPLIGRGTDTWDPVCLLARGHRGVCSPTKPHLYRFKGIWWVSRNGWDSHKSSVTLNDVGVGSLQGAIDYVELGL
jgi:hypothetical protein